MLPLSILAEVFYFQGMKIKLLLSFLAMALMIFVMRWQGETLVTEVSPRGIIDLEFARTTERLQQLQAVWQWKDLQLNIFLDFIFISAYTWFFATSAIRVKKHWDWTRISLLFITLAYLAGMLDVVENIFMYIAFTNNIGASGLKFIFYCAKVKFILIAVLIFYLLISIPFMRKKKQQLGVR